MQKLFFHERSLILMLGFLLLSGCGKQEEKPQHKHILDNNHPLAMPHVEASSSDHVVVDKLPDPEHPQHAQEHPVMPMESNSSDESMKETVGKEKKQKKDRVEKEQDDNNDTTPSKTIDFEVENKTGKTIYVTCFSYVKRRDFSRWRWEKSDIYRIKDDDHAIIRMDKIEDPQDRRSVQGYLAVFNTEQEAHDSTYELLKEENQIDLDEISKLHGKKVVIMVEKYGMRGEYLEYDFVDKNEDPNKKYPSLDFPVENKTGKTLFATCFVYEKRAKGRWLVAVEDKDDAAIWRYEKTNVVKILPNKQKMIHVDTIAVKRDRDALEGYLAIFDEDEEQMAQDSIYELLESSRKLNLGVLSRLENKKIVLDIERYGVSGDLIDFTIKPTRKIDFTKIIK